MYKKHPGHKEGSKVQKYQKKKKKFRLQASSLFRGAPPSTPGKNDATAGPPPGPTTIKKSCHPSHPHLSVERSAHFALDEYHKTRMIIQPKIQDCFHGLVVIIRFFGWQLVWNRGFSPSFFILFYFFLVCLLFNPPPHTDRRRY